MRFRVSGAGPLSIGRGCPDYKDYRWGPGNEPWPTPRSIQGGDALTTGIVRVRCHAIELSDRSRLDMEANIETPHRPPGEGSRRSPDPSSGKRSGDSRIRTGDLLLAKIHPRGPNPEKGSGLRGIHG